MKKRSENIVRIDKWLWAVRIYKTRSKATNACNKGRIFIDDAPVKPSRNVSVNEIVTVKKPPVNYTFKIKGLLRKRQSAKIADSCIEDLTPQEELKKLKPNEIPVFGFREKGKGRPTKKDRRIMDRFKNNFNH